MAVVEKSAVRDGESAGILSGQVIADVNEVVSDNPEPNPALHTVRSLVSAALQPVPAFENADSSFASRAPLLKLLEPPLLLSLLARRTLGGVAGNRNSPHSHLLRLGFIGGGEKSRIGGHTFGHA